MTTLKRILLPAIAALACLVPTRSPAAEPYPVPVIDLNDQTDRQVVVDREAGQYLGHPTTVLLEDGKTMLCVYPKGTAAGRSS